MVAWGGKPFQNQLAAEYMLVMVNTNIHNVILEPVDRSTSFLKHKLAYHYDRFRAAIELMITFEQNGSFNFAKGYYDLAIEKLNIVKNDKVWLDSWDNESHTRSKNYLLDVDRQLSLLASLRDLAKE